MNEAVEFVGNNWVVISTGLAGLLAIGALIAAKTKTKKDDEVISWLQRLLRLIPGVKK